MPSWENAPSRKIEVVEEPETHEMDKLDPKNAYNIPTGQDREEPTIPGVTAPTPRRPNGPGSPFSEQDSFLHGNRYGNQQGGYADSHNAYAALDSHSGYRGASPTYGYNNQQQYGGIQQQYGGNQPYRNDPYSSGPVSPLYAPSGSTAYEPPARHYAENNQQQGQLSPYGMNQPARKPLNGSWRDV